jgi:hypothetical protein
LKSVLLGVKFPGICEEAERSGSSDLVRDSDPLVVFLEKGGRLWPAANQVAVFIVLDPPKTMNKETDDTAPDLRDSDPASKTPSPQTPRPAADLGALKSSKNREGEEVVNRVSENVTPTGSPPEMREKYQRLLEILRKPRDVATWRRLAETEPPSDVKLRTFGAGDLVMLNAREFIGVAAGGTLLLGMRYRCKRVVDQYAGEAREPSMAA